MAPTIDDFHLLVNSLPNEISERIKPLKWDWFPKDVPFTISSSDKTLNLATDRHSPGRDPRPSVQSNPQEVEEQFPQVIVAEKPDFWFIQSSIKDPSNNFIVAGKKTTDSFVVPDGGFAIDLSEASSSTPRRLILSEKNSEFSAFNVVATSTRGLVLLYSPALKKFLARRKDPTTSGNILRFVHLPTPPTPSQDQDLHTSSALLEKQLADLSWKLNPIGNVPLVDHWRLRHETTGQIINSMAGVRKASLFEDIGKELKPDVSVLQQFPWMGTSSLSIEESLILLPVGKDLVPSPSEIWKADVPDRLPGTLTNEATDQAGKDAGFPGGSGTMRAIRYITADGQQRYLVYRSTASGPTGGFLAATAIPPSVIGLEADLVLCFTKPDLVANSALSSLDDTWLDTRIVRMAMREEEKGKKDFEASFNFLLWDLKPAYTQPSPGRYLFNHLDKQLTMSPSEDEQNSPIIAKQSHDDLNLWDLSIDTEQSTWDAKRYRITHKSTGRELRSDTVDRVNASRAHGQDALRQVWIIAAPMSTPETFILSQNVTAGNVNTTVIKRLSIDATGSRLELSAETDAAASTPWNLVTWSARQLLPAAIPPKGPGFDEKEVILIHIGTRRCLEGSPASPSAAPVRLGTTANIDRSCAWTMKRSKQVSGLASVICLHFDMQNFGSAMLRQDNALFVGSITKAAELILEGDGPEVYKVKIGDNYLEALGSGEVSFGGTVTNDRWRILDAELAGLPGLRTLRQVSLPKLNDVCNATPVPTGLYRITYGTLALSSTSRTFVPDIPVLNAGETLSIWYISSTSQGYTLQDCFKPGLFLDRGDPQLSCAWKGDAAYLMPRFANELTQSWFFKKTSQGCFQIFPALGEGELGIDASPSSSDSISVVLGKQSSPMWKLEPYRLAISTGWYNITTLTLELLSADFASGTIRAIEPGFRPSIASTRWKIINNRDGTFLIIAKGDKPYLTMIMQESPVGDDRASSELKAVLSSKLNADFSRWFINPVAGHTNYDIINCATSVRLTTLDQIKLPASGPFDIQRVVSNDRSFDDWPSEKITSGLYKVRLSSSGKVLSSFPMTMPNVRIQPNLNATNAQATTAFAIMATQDGYFTFMLADGSACLCHEDDICGTTIMNGIDSTKWKLIKDTSGGCRIVNKGSGQLLTSIEGHGMSCSIASTSGQGQIWNLEAIEGATAPFVGKREVLFPNGTYAIESFSKGFLTVSPQGSWDTSVQIVDPLERDARLSLYTLSIVDNFGWFTIAAYMKDQKLDSPMPGVLTWDESWRGKAETSQYSRHWKFVQDSGPADSCYIVNRKFPVVLRCPQEIPFPVLSESFSADASTRFTVHQWIGRSLLTSREEFRIPLGVYNISTTIAGPSSLSDSSTIITENPASAGPKALTTFSSASAEFAAGQNSLSLLPVDSTNGHQLWRIERSASDTAMYTIKSLTSFPSYQIVRLNDFAAVVPASETATIGMGAFWLISRNKSGTYFLRSVDVSGTTSHAAENFLGFDGNIDRVLKSNGGVGNNARSSINIGPSSLALEWTLTRAGYYVRNRADPLPIMCAPNTGKLQVMNYKLYSTPTHCIWHLTRLEDSAYPWVKSAKFVLINESSGLPVCSRYTPVEDKNSKPGAQDIFVPTKASEVGRLFPFSLSKDDTNLQLSLLDKNSFITAPRSNAPAPECFLAEFFSVPKLLRSWDLCPYINTEGGGLLNLPRRYVTIGGFESFTVSLSPDSKTFSGVKLMENRSQQRFRELSLGTSSMFINEFDPSMVLNRDDVIARGRNGTWKPTNVDQEELTVANWVSRKVFDTSSPFQFRNQTGDLDASFATYRIRNIQTKDGLGCFLTRSSTGEVLLAEIDETDGEQLWLIKQSLFRHFVHAKTREYLALLPLQLVKSSDDATNFQVWWRGPQRDNNGGVDMWWGIDADVRPEGHDDNERTPLIAQPPLNIFRFIRTSTQPSLCSTRQQLEIFLRANAPIFVQDKKCADNRAASINEYIGNTILSQKGGFPFSTSWLSEKPFDSARPFTLSPDKFPLGLSRTPKVYVTVRPAADPDYLNYTDVIYHLFFPPSRIGFTPGWRSISCRYNNTTMQLEGARIGTSSWMSNIDNNLMIVMIKEVRNPLKIITNKKSQKVKLHIYLDENLNPSFTFPDPPRKPLVIPPGGHFSTVSLDAFKPTEVERNAFISDEGNWGFTWDAGQAEQHEVIEAHMLVDSGLGGRPVPPQWTRYQGYWSNRETFVTGDPEKTGRFPLS